MNPGTIAFHHFGCKVNFAEASSLSRQFKEKGWTLINFHEKADVYVISSCVVTGVAEKKCRAAIRQAHKLNPGAKIAVIGCFPELKPRELEVMEGVDLVLGHSDKFRLLQEMENLDVREYHKNQEVKDKQKNDYFIPSFSYGDRTRSFLKIQDGCDYYCSYCTIPLARGHSRSDTITHVLNTVKNIAQSGVKEIVLTGVNIGDFWKQNSETFLELLQKLENLNVVQRMRISSIEPDLLTDEIVDIVANSKIFLPHFHIPLQSGSNKILKSMHRKYERELYQNMVNKIRSRLPLACIATDVIVGFPGETDENFLDTYQFLETLPISYMHVFTYSKRENTLASKNTSQVPDVICKERSILLHSLSAEKKRSFYQKNLGRIAQVLWESNDMTGYMHGFTENYIRAKTLFKPEWINQIMEIHLDKFDDDGFYLIK